jgi:hypothetical protein
MNAAAHQVAAAANATGPPSLSPTPRRNSLIGSLARLSSRAAFVEKQAFAPDVLGEDKTASAIPVLRGYLFKESRYGRMQRRYYATNNAYLNYYKKSQSFKRKRVLASIDLRQTSTVCVLVRNGKPSRRIAIQVQTGLNTEECVFLRAKTRKQAGEWVDGLNQRKRFWVVESRVLEDGSTVNRELVELMDGWEDRDDGMWAADEGEEEEDTDEGFVSCQEDEAGLAILARRTSSRGLGGGGAGSDSDALGGGGADDDSPEEYSGDEQQTTGTLGNHLRRLTRTSSAMMRVEAVLPSPCKFASVPPCWSSQYWSQPSTKALRVRGPYYLDDREKVAPSAFPLMELVALDVQSTEGRRLDHIALHPNNRLRLATERGEKLPFIWICNFQVPGPPFFHFACYFVAANEDINKLFDPSSKHVPTHDDRTSTAYPPGFRKLLLDFFRGESDEFRDQHFKLIPRVEEGPWVVRVGVPSKPALIGTKLKNRYFRGENYLEMDVDASVVALKLAQMAIGFCRLVTVDMAFLLEGKEPDQLPEQVLAIVRARSPDFRVMPSIGATQAVFSSSSSLV